MEITLSLNGEERTFSTDPDESLLRLLRRHGIFSVRFGSDTGETGAAAVLLDGRLVNADILLAAQADGHAVETVEGMAHGLDLHPIQEAFIRTGAIQSGYSTPAMVLAARELLEKTPTPTEEEVRDALSGILDRETGYVRPVQAVLEAAAVLRGEDPSPMEPTILTPISIYDQDFLDFFRGKDGGEDGAPGERPPEGERFTPEVDTKTEVGVRPPKHIVATDVPETKVVGQPETKVDAVKLVKGNPAFTDDFEMRGMLYAKLLTSPHAHARILEIDDAEARALPGVHAVIHYKNIPRVRYASGGQSYPNPRPYDQVSFDDKVRYVGDRVAAVAAESVAIAEEALKFIKVEYEELPAVFDEREAIKEGAPVIHDEPEMEGAGAYDPEHNISHYIEAEVGDVEQGFAQAEHVFEQTYRVHQVQQCPIEPHIAISYWDADERLVIRTSTQVPFHVRRMVAPLLGLPVRRIRVIKPRIGGGFGVKQEMLIEDIVGHLTMITGRPVRLELTREEEFVSSRTRHPQTITYKTGVDAEGALVAQQMTVLGNTGPYATHGLTVQTVTGLRGLSTYNCPNKRFDCRVVYTNIPVPGAYRGYGAPQALFALEVHMEEVAEALGMDVIAFKAKNWVRVGDPLDIAPHLGEGEAENVHEIPIILSSGLEECIAQGMEAIDWHRRQDPEWRRVPGKPHLRRGLGMAVCMHGTAIPNLDMGGASIKINDDGSFNLLVGATDLGTGSDTVLSQIAAEVLGVPLQDIIIYSSDTDMTPFDTGAYASSTTYISGTAVKRAAEAVREQIKERAALMLDLKEWSNVVLGDRRAHAPDGRSVSLEDIALHSLHQQDQRQIMATASFVSGESPPPFAGQFAEVEVDTETGQVTVTKLIMAVDCGVAINPITAAGQVEGGMTQALGYAHCEEMVYDDQGALLNPHFGPYKIYRADEMPEMDVILVQTVEPSGPFGAKAVAEIPKDGVAPALASAIHDATGVWIREIPFTPERVSRALQAAHENEQ
ncbi:MAG: molybdopterin cofactor-binding domain-containing protein [Candidatus Promineifilaceae bacterium]|nr:molybdopterin cofactor-binding domain-containing protein [Candidatus Promineifilaceae bacterium]